MKAIEILNKLAKELEESYLTIDEFCGWATLNSNVEIMHESIVYCIDYSITANRQVKSELSVMKPEIVEGKKKWFKCGCDKDFIAFIESSINQLLPILFDERLQQRLDEEQSQDEEISDHIQMMDTYRSLSLYR